MFGSTSTHVLETEVTASGVSSFDNSMASAAGSVSSFEAAVAGAGGALAAVSAGGLAKSIDAAADFDAAMTESLAIMGDVSDAMRGDMEEAARSVARTTTHSAEEAANSYFYLASAGLDAKESVKAMPQVAEFAQAGMFDMERATDLLTDSASALGMEMDNLSELGDKFVKANTLANTSVEQVAEAMTNKAAPAMDRLGVSTDEGIAALSVFADQGLKGRRAGTILARTLEGLDQQARENTEAFEELGVEVFDANGEMRPMESIIQDLESGLAGMSTKQKQAAIEQLGFNQRAAQGLDLLIGNSEQLAEYEGELANAGGTAAEIAEKQLQTLNEQWGLLKDNLHDVAISIGGVFLPALTSLASSVVGAVQRFAEWNSKLDGMPGAVALVSGVIGGLTTAIMALQGTAIAAAIPSIGTLVAALGAIAAPVTAAIAVIGTLAAAWKTNFGGIRDVTLSATSAIQATIQGWVASLQATIQPHLDQLRFDWMQFWQVIETQASVALNTISSVIGAGLEVWNNLFGGVGQQILQTVDSTFGSVVATINNVLDTIAGTTAARLVSLSNAWRTHRDDVVATATQLSQNVIARFNALRAKIGPAVTVIRDVVVGAFQGIQQKVSALWQTFAPPIVSAFNQIRDRAVELGQRLGILEEGGKSLAQTVGMILGPALLGLAIGGGPIMAVVGAIGTLAVAWQKNIGGIQQKTEVAVERITTELRRIDTAIVTPGLTAIGSQFDTETASWRDVTTLRMDEIRSGIEQRITQLRTSAGTLWEMHGQDIADILTRTRDLALEIVTSLMSGLLQVIKPILAQVAQFWNQNKEDILFILGALSSAAITITTTLMSHFLNAVEQGLSAAQKFWSLFGDEIIAVIEFTVDVVLTAVGLMISTLRSLIEAGVAAMEGDWGAAWGHIEDIGRNTTETIMSFMKTWGSRLLDWLGGLVGDIIGWFKDLAHSLIGGSVIPEMLSAILSAFKSWGGDAYNVVFGALNKIYKFFGTAKNKLVSRVESMVSSMQSKLTSKLSAFRNAGKGLVDSFASGIRSKISKVKNAASDVASAADKYLPGSDAEVGPLDNVSEAGPGLVLEVADGMTDNLRALRRAASAAAEAAHPDLDAASLPVEPSVLAGTGSQKTSNSHTYDIDIEVHSSDPDRAGDAVFKKLNREMSSGGM